MSGWGWFKDDPLSSSQFLKKQNMDPTVPAGSSAVARKVDDTEAVSRGLARRWQILY